MIPAPSGGASDYTELSRSRKGRVFRKHILTKGDLIHPVTRQKIRIDDEFVSRLIDNFDNKVCDIVQVPLADSANRHSEDPTRNIGEVIGLEESEGKVYALIDARDDEHAPKLGKTLLGASALLSTNYTDNRKDTKVGPTLLHVCVTNRPYVTGLEDFEEVIAASSDNSGDIVLLTQEEKSVPTKDELLSVLKESHGIDVAEMEVKLSALVAEISEKENRVPTKDELLTELKESHGIDVTDMDLRLSAVSEDESLVRQLGAALVTAELISLSEDQEATADVVLSGVLALAEANAALNSRLTASASTIEELQQREAEVVKLAATSEVDDLVAQGRILPAQRDAFLELKLAGSELFDKLVPETPLVELSVESGTAASDENGRKPEADVEAEIIRLTDPDGPASTYVKKG